MLNNIQVITYNDIFGTWRVVLFKGYLSPSDGAAADKNPLLCNKFSFHISLYTVYQFQNTLDSTGNRLKQWSLWSTPSESSSSVLPLAALAWKPRQSGEHCGRSANRSHGGENKQRATHTQAHILKTCVATPLASSAVLQSKETPDLFHHQANERAPFFCTTPLCCNTLYG